MKSDKKILIAFLLNLAFSFFEFFGGIYTGSVAIISDSLHDFGDAISIGISCFLEKLSKKQPDKTHTYGYLRYSVLGSMITTVILLFGSLIIILNAVNRIINPAIINYDGMIVFAVFGIMVNTVATVFTSGGVSLNQKAVSIHMLEDVLGWIVILLGAIVIKVTDFALVDPIMSIGVAIFIVITAVKNLKETLDVFLEKTPASVDIDELKKHILDISGVIDVHHIHIWSMDGSCNYATMHVVTSGDFHDIKESIRKELSEHGIAHVTLELESENEECHNKYCHIDFKPEVCHHHHHHH